MPWEPVPQPKPRPRLMGRVHTFINNVEASILKMAELPARMERNIKILIAVIIGSLLLIHFMNRRKG